ncbi:MAG: glutamate racemase [Candidatus Omnitrophota bacterium]|jgi:glutamate racemase
MKPIGVFDSGIGGLTVVKELIRQLPGEDIIYLGDTAHLPYGTKSAATIIRFTLNNILFLLKQNTKLIVVACNTASSLALDAIRKHFQVPIIGVIQPGAQEAAGVTQTRCVGIIGTRATIKSKAYERQIKRINPAIKVISQACPLFVPLVEEGWLNQRETFDIASKYLKPLIKKNHKLDALILGCTHYPLLKPVIRRVLGRRIKLIDSAQQVVREVSKNLESKAMTKGNHKAKGKYQFYVTDDPDGFAHQAVRFLGYRLSRVKKINHV